MPVDLNRLTAGWLQLESDPGLFTLLLEDFGVKGVQVEEIYDLQKSMEGPVYGFIFLFKWIEERRSRRKVVVPDECFVEEEDTVNSIFFAQQMVPNSCATHALLSVLLNCSKIHLGPTLTRLKEYTKNMSPENKGYAIGNTPELARAHNSHAKPEPFHRQEKSHGISTGRTMEAFHFVSYVPINGRLFELDGLKPYPIDHGPWAEVEDWTEKFRRVITERLGIATGGEPYHDIRFNLMAVVPDRRIAYEQKLRTLKTNRQIVLEALQQLVKLTHPELTSDDHNACMAAVNKTKSEQSKNTAEQDDDNKEADQQQAANSNSQQQSAPNLLIPKLPPALDSHNYAKSPLMEGLARNTTESRPRYEEYSGSEYSEEDDAAESAKAAAAQSSSLQQQQTAHSTRPSQSVCSEQASDGAATHEAGDSPAMKPLTINTSSDLMKPLTIQTKFHSSPCPSASSTDTSSEAGSAFNSPVRYYSPVQSSPNSLTGKAPSGSSSSKGPPSSENYFDDVHDIRQFVVIRVTSKSNNNKAEQNEQAKADGTACKRINDPVSGEVAEPDTKRPCLSQDNAETMQQDLVDKEQEANNKSENGKTNEGEQTNVANQEGEKNSSKQSISKHPHLMEPHKFAPKDLLALLKTVENEIKIYEANLRDEIEKRKKYKVDDCRRTHNYDQFICTFLSMLAEQGKLADLVEQQLMVRRRQGSGIGRMQKTNKPDRRRKSRPKKRK